MQASAFANQEAEHKVLEDSILFFGRNASRNVAQINILGLRRRGIAKRRRTKVGNFKLLGDASVFLIVLEYPADEFQITIKGGGKLTDVFLLHPAVKHLLLQWDEHTFVGIASGLTLVVEGPHEGVGEEHPWKSFRIEIVRHHGAVRHRALDVYLVENRIEISRAWILFSHLSLLLEQPFRVIGRGVAIGIAE